MNNLDYEFELISGVFSGEELQIVNSMAAPSSLIYTSQNFLRLISQFLNCELYQIVARKKGKLVGYMPYVQKTSKYGTVVNSLPFFGSNGGPVPILNNENVNNLLLNEFLKNIKSIPKILSSTVIENPLFPISRDKNDSSIIGKSTDSRISQITNLSNLKNEDDLIKILSQPRPRNINKARRLGIKVVEDSSNDAINFLSESHKSNIDAKNGLSKSLHFFNQLKNELHSSEWKIHIAKLNEKPISALLTLRHNKIVEYFTPTILSEYRNTQALSLLIFEAMRGSIIDGFNYWNWGGTWTSQLGVYDFKKRWAAEDKIYNYFTIIFDDAIYKIPREELTLHYTNFYVYPFKKM